MQGSGDWDLDVPDLQLTRWSFSNASIYDLRLLNGPLMVGCSHGMLGVPPLVYSLYSNPKLQTSLIDADWLSEPGSVFAIHVSDGMNCAGMN